MATKVNISDPQNKNKAKVTKDGSILVSSIPAPIPVVGDKNAYRYYSAILGSTGADSGTTNQNVNGSVTPQQFYISSNNDYDIYIMRIAVLIADSAAVHGSFGNVSALTVGWDLILNEAGNTTYFINKAKTGGQVIAQAGFAEPYGDGATSFTLTNWTGTEDATTIIFPISDYVPGGVRIGRGTLDQLTSVVNDNLTGLTQFIVRVFGYVRYP